MIKISTKSQYGLRAMTFLAKCKKEICPLKEISKKEGISFDYLEKIISRLEKANLINSKKGARGGYYLAKSPEKIRVGEIIRSLEGNTSLVKCTAKRGKCPLGSKCFAKKFWNKLQKSLDSTLDSLTLADLIK